MSSPYRTLLDALAAAAQAKGGPKTGYTFLDGAQTDYVSFAEVERQAKRYAGALQQQGLQKGDRVLLIVPTSAEFATIYLGLLLCGAVPCVLPDPDLVRHPAEGVRRILTIAQQVSASLLITQSAIDLSQADLNVSLPQRTVADLQANLDHPWQPVAVSGDDVALIQASSGTTGLPKCITLTHRNILANIQQIGWRLQVVGDDVVVSWLPLFHDMGLIGCFLFSLTWQLHGVFMTPYRFLRRPGTWLKAISDHGGTLSPAPNFAYALCTAGHRSGDKRPRFVHLAGRDVRGRANRRRHAPCLRQTLCRDRLSRHQPGALLRPGRSRFVRGYAPAGPTRPIRASRPDHSGQRESCSTE